MLPFLLGIFFFTSLRFFIGNQLHLLSEALVGLPGLVWLYDLMAIIAQSVVLIFLGATANIEVNRGVGDLGFLEFLVLLYVIDVGWVLSQKLLGALVQAWKRERVPMGWAFLNTGLIVGLLVIRGFSADVYSLPAVWWMFGLSVAGFVVDVVLLDHYDCL